MPSSDPSIINPFVLAFELQKHFAQFHKLQDSRYSIFIPNHYSWHNDPIESHHFPQASIHSFVHQLPSVYGVPGSSRQLDYQAFKMNCYSACMFNTFQSFLSSTITIKQVVSYQDLSVQNLERQISYIYILLKIQIFLQLQSCKDKSK